MHNIIILSGPSGCGKSTLLHRLLKEFNDVKFSVSHTTRSRRGGEVDGREYFFLPPRQFQEMVEKGAFAEWARVHNHFYGTSWKEIEEKSTVNQILILDVDVQGARNIRHQFSETTLIFIFPPSLAELKKRLIGREGRMNEDIEKRLQDATGELKEAGAYDYVIINDNQDHAYDALRSIYIAYVHATIRNRQVIDRIREGGK